MQIKPTTKKRIVSNVLAPLLAAVILLCVWAIATAAVGESLIVPSPIETFAQLIRLLSEWPFYRALLGTLSRGAIGFVVSAGLALVTASLGFLFRPVRVFFRTVVAVLRAVPTMSVILLFLLWTNANVAPILVSALVIFPALYSSLTAAHDSIDVSLMDYTRLMPLGGGQKLTHVFLPLSMPSFLEATATAGSLNIKLLLAAEVLAQTRHSLGLLMQLTQISFDTARLLALTVAAVVVASLCEAILLAVKHVAIRKLFG